MELFKLRDISPNDFLKLKDSKVDCFCPKCHFKFHGCDAHLSINNATEHDGSKEFKAITFKGNNYFLTCHSCFAVLPHGFGRVYGGINGRAYM